MFSNFQQQQHHNLFHTSRECQTSEEDDSRGSGGPATLTPHKPFSAISGSSDGATIEIGRRPRGRPPGSKNKPKSPLIITHEPEPAMSPHVLEIPEGSDIVEAISRFSNRRKTGLCILTGSGAVANVTLRQPSAPPGTTVIFHGRFNILSISATFLVPSESSPPIHKEFSISLAGPQGQIIGGFVVGRLLAAGTVFVIAASFNNPSYHRLPLEEDVRNNTVSGGCVMEANFGCCFFLLVLLVPFTCAGRAVMSTTTGSGDGSIQKLDVQKHLKNLNRPPVKSIKSPDGDIIDCVHVSHQPAFDHPDLKNHKIQMRPNFHPEGNTFGESKVSLDSKPITQLWHKSGRCSEGTIPIRRTKKDDILRASSVQSFGKKKLKSTPQPKPAKPLPDLFTQSGHQHAIAYVDGGNFYGAKATINVWDPKIQQPNEFSLSQIWILAGSFNQDLNSIEAGWQVSPDLYGDNNTRLFTYWTSDAYQATGCYNLLCSGFIQINNDIALGASISPLSNYGSSQYDISLLVWKDPKEGNWWMQFGNDHVLGYWPAPLFSYLTESASMIEWGGEVVNSESDGQHTSTQMGSGHFPDEGFGKASYFKNIQVVDGDNKLRAPKDLGTYTEKENCYNVKTGSAGDWGTYFYYGGPGRNPNCQ